MYRYLFLLPLIALVAGCKVYSFSGASIDPKVKTIKLDNFENKAQFINPSLAPQLQDAVRKKVVGQTRLTQTNSDNADYEVGGYISSYGVSTSGISNQQASSSRLVATFHIVFHNHLDPTGKNVTPADFEDDVTSSIDFPANQSFSAVESQLLSSIVTNMSNDIFNRLFSNW
ncbi:LPS assembly lipoprotein LptE [Dinghuibacter silviterrae]|uniref:Lipopolysaccharide assembly protein n=1 Tax=Dinghuibacter silviterrae TaxID=1539049 RepID=A0A4R8DHZ7_9BACT|nr:LPS assembly lipoprotein LptE [Dinghuibacter silviterrae]TDW97369.1 lipopolysaccharide assembly protein [Dinghuibacter silviterrae]